MGATEKITYMYKPILRPVSSFTLPAGIKWEFAEAPADIAHLRKDIPASRHRYGIIELDRRLSKEERERFGMEIV